MKGEAGASMGESVCDWGVPPDDWERKELVDE